MPWDTAAATGQSTGYGEILSYALGITREDDKLLVSKILTSFSSRGSAGALFVDCLVSSSKDMTKCIVFELHTTIQ